MPLPRAPVPRSFVSLLWVFVRAQTRIQAGALIGEYVGEVMSEDDWQARQVRKARIGRDVSGVVVRRLLRVTYTRVHVRQLRQRFCASAFVLQSAALIDSRSRCGTSCFVLVCAIVFFFKVFRWSFGLYKDARFLVFVCCRPSSTRTKSISS